MQVVLTDLEETLVHALSRMGGVAEREELSRSTGEQRDKVASALASLESKGLVRTSREREVVYRLTREGEEYARKGVPERRLARLLIEAGGRERIEKLSERLGASSLAIALTWARRKGWVEVKRVDGERYVVLAKTPEEGEDEKFLRELLRKGMFKVTREGKKPLSVLEILRRRGLVTSEERTLIRARLTEKGWKVARGEVKVIREVARLTRDLIVTGRWKEVKLKQYDVRSQPPALLLGRKHPYVEFIERFRRIMLDMGFKEVTGPYVELEFWNFDVLFQAQDHPAREVHDCFKLKHPKEGFLPDKELVERVRKVHEDGWETGSKGWRYRWDPKRAACLVLRSQTTAVSARYLASGPSLPVKVFCISRIFRPDVLDATHSMEFYQCDGIIADHGVNFRHLLGVLKEIFARLGIKKVKFKPAYFPFTEPSVEVYAYHPRLGWVESAGAGIFRPEVVRPLGLNCPVLAWGIGVDRLAMALMGINDIRQLFSDSLSFLREFKARW